MKNLVKNKKIQYIVIALLIIIGIISIFTLRLNFTLMYSEHTRINVYLGKECDLQDIKQIVAETLGKQELFYQEIETFRDSVAINVKSASEEQINLLETKIKEKYEINEDESIIVEETVPHLRGRDIVKPYIIPMIIVTLVILAYVGVRYLNLGLIKVISTLIVRLVLSQALLLSIIAIVRIPIGVYTMPIAILLYIGITIYTVVQNENTLQINKAKNEKK